MPEHSPVSPPQSQVMQRLRMHGRALLPGLWLWWQMHRNAFLACLPLDLKPEHVLELLALVPGLLQTLCLQLRDPVRAQASYMAWQRQRSRGSSLVVETCLDHEELHTPTDLSAVLAVIWHATAAKLQWTAKRTRKHTEPSLT